MTAKPVFRRTYTGKTYVRLSEAEAKDVLFKAHIAELCARLGFGWCIRPVRTHTGEFRMYCGGNNLTYKGTTL